MAISYNVYTNDGLGGEIDYDSPIATTPSLSYTVGPLAVSSDNSFGVRAFDTVSGIEEANTNASVRIIIDSSGNDVTAQPNAVVGLSASPTPGETCWVSWGYDPTGQGGSPVRFQVFVTTGPTPTLLSPVATIDYLPGVSGYGCPISGLTGNTLSTIAVQAVGGQNNLVSGVKTVSITYQANPLSNVDSLVALPSP